MGAGLLGRDLVQLFQWRLAERAAGSGQQNPPHAHLLQPARIIAGQALEDRIVFAVDGQQDRAAAPHRLDEQGAGHHQRLLVGQQDLLARLDRRQRRLEPGRPDDSRHHRIHLGMGSHLAQALFAEQHPRRQARGMQGALQMARRTLIRHHGVARPVEQAQRLQLNQTTEAGQGEHLITRGMPGDHVQGAEADGTRRPEHRNLLQLAHRAPQPASHSSAANIGMAAVRLSMRSSTPPCPGSRLLLSLSPAWRLNMLSVRSPTTEIDTTSAAPASTRSHSLTDQPRYRPTAVVINKLANKPPATPSQLLPGLTCGASLRLPKALPVK
ncbi:hypothetical protein D3C71_1429740 [compost metagenome]